MNLPPQMTSPGTGRSDLSPRQPQVFAAEVDCEKVCPNPPDHAHYVACMAAYGCPVK